MCSEIHSNGASLGNLKVIKLTWGLVWGIGVGKPRLRGRTINKSHVATEGQQLWYQLGFSFFGLEVIS